MKLRIVRCASGSLSCSSVIPWTLRRDDRTKTVMRTWVCVECQTLQERPEPE